MKKLLLFATCLLMGSLGFAQNNPSDKTLIKTLDPQGATAILFSFKNNGINATSTGNSTLRIELEIHANIDEQTLERLIKAGRYTLEGAKTGEDFVITAPNLEKRVTINGIDLEEKVVVNVKMPANYLFDKEKQSIKRDVVDFVKRGDSSEKIAQLSQITEQLNVSVKLVRPKATRASKKVKPDDLAPSLKTPNNSSTSKEASGKGNKADAKYGDILINGVPIGVD